MWYILQHNLHKSFLESASYCASFDCCTTIIRGNVGAWQPSWAKSTVASIRWYAVMVLDTKEVVESAVQAGWRMSLFRDEAPQQAPAFH